MTYIHTRHPPQRPLAMQLVCDQAEALGLRVDVIDQISGLLIRIEDPATGAGRFVMPSNFPLNSLTASSVARDKAYTYHVCERAGLTVPEGDYFFTDGDAPFAAGKAREAALAYADALGYPVVFKPNSMTKGRHVSLVGDPDTLSRAITTLGRDDHVYIVQRPVRGDDYRVLLLDGQVHIAYQRRPLVLRGDGRASVRDLIAAWPALEHNHEARATLEARGMTWDTALPDGHTLVLCEFNKNLNMGGAAVDRTDQLPAPVARACRRATELVGLRVCGVDCIARGDAVHIIELNAKPSLRGYYEQCVDARHRVRAFYRAVLAAMFA